MYEKDNNFIRGGVLILFFFIFVKCNEYLLIKEVKNLIIEDFFLENNRIIIDKSIKLELKKINLENVKFVFYIKFVKFDSLDVKVVFDIFIL